MIENCIFCQIATKKIPAEIVYEDDNFLAFLDIHPQSPGHCQVIPKTHYRWVWQVPNIGKYFEAVAKIARAQQRAFEQEMILSKIVGDEVPHAHIWIFPAPQSTTGSKTDFKSNGEKIRKNLI